MNTFSYLRKFEKNKSKMSDKKQFGIWMDSEHATIVGKEDLSTGNFKVLAHVKGETGHGNSNEKSANNEEIMLTRKFFKDITSHMPNVDEIHVTGTGQVQEQFINFLAETPQFKNTKTTECTSNKMSDEALIEHIESKFN